MQRWVRRTGWEAAKRAERVCGGFTEVTAELDPERGARDQQVEEEGRASKQRERRGQKQSEREGSNKGKWLGVGDQTSQS